MPLRKYELNTTKLLKGRIEGKRFPIWDTVKDCNEEECLLVKECLYDRKSNENGSEGKCKMQGHFLRTMMDIVLDNLPAERCTEYSLQKIGLNLLPLYKQLVSLQMLEQTLDDITIGDGDKVKIHPVYKEIRIVTKDIDKCLRSLGIDINVTADGKKAVDSATGDSDYYDEMMGDHEEEAQSHKKKREL